MYKKKYLKYKAKYLNLKIKAKYCALGGAHDVGAIIDSYRERYKNFFNDELLIDYKELVLSIKTLLEIPVENSIQINDHILEENYFKIVDADFIDGTQFVNEILKK